MKNTLAVFYFICGLVFLELMDAVAKLLVSYHYHPAEILVIRSIFIVLVLLLLSTTKRYPLIIRKPRQLLLRGIIGFLSPFGFFLALKTLALADAIVVFFVSTFMITALSALILKERVGIHRLGAVVVGFIGVFIAMNPQGKGSLTAYFWVWLAALSYAYFIVSGRKLSQTSSVNAVVLISNLAVGLVGCLFLPFVWQDVDGRALILIIAMATCALLGSLATTKALQNCEASFLAPFDYLAIVLAALLGFWLFDEVPQHRLWLGALFIVLAGLYTTWREVRGKRA